MNTMSTFVGCDIFMEANKNVLSVAQETKTFSDYWAPSQEKNHTQNLLYMAFIPYYDLKQSL